MFRWRVKLHFAPEVAAINCQINKIYPGSVYSLATSDVISDKIITSPEA